MPKHALPGDYPDFRFTDHGTIWLVAPLTDAADKHLKAHTDGTWFGGALAVEHRFVADLAAQLQADGFNLEGPSR
jgi:hypothetical protein